MTPTHSISNADPPLPQTTNAGPEASQEPVKSLQSLTDTATYITYDPDPTTIQSDSSDPMSGTIPGIVSSNLLQTVSPSPSYASPVATGDPDASTAVVTPTSPNVADPLMSAIAALASSVYEASDSSPPSIPIITSAEASPTEISSGTSAGSSLTALLASTAASLTLDPSIGQLPSSVDGDQSPFTTVEPSPTDPAAVADMPKSSLPSIMQTITITGGAVISAMASGSSILLAADGTITEIAGGQSANIGAHTIVASGTAAIIADGNSAVPLTQVEKPSSNGQATAATTDPIQTPSQPSNSVSRSSQGIINSQGSAIATLSAGADPAVSSHTISAPPSTGPVPIDGSSTVPAYLPPVETNQPLEVHETPGALIASQNGSAVTLSPGEQTTFAGHNLSAAASSSVVVVDGQSTVTAQDVSTASTVLPVVGTQAPGASSTAADSGTAVTRAPPSMVGRVAVVIVLFVAGIA